MSEFDYGTKRPDGQYEHHPGLPDAAIRDKVRPVREDYIHNACGVVTRMPRHCAETYAVNPKFYGRTFCCACCDYFPVSEFRWLDDDTEVGS